MLPYINVHTNTHLNLLIITEKDVPAIIKSLDPKKSHGWDNISINIIKICEESLTMIFGNEIGNDIF